jgi:hypothetical protein
MSVFVSLTSSYGCILSKQPVTNTWSSVAYCVIFLEYATMQTCKNDLWHFLHDFVVKWCSVIHTSSTFENLIFALHMSEKKTAQESDILR